MNFEEYTKKATRTDLEDYSEAKKRANKVKSNLKSLLETIKESGSLLDKIKKHVFYNKEIILHKSSNKQYKELSNSDVRVIHCIIGIVTEAAELSDIAIKLLTEGSIDYVNLIEEIGDCAWYLALGVDECNKFLCSDIDVLEVNIQKLKQRYPSKFTEKDAVNRNITKERKTLKKHINA